MSATKVAPLSGVLSVVLIFGGEGAVGNAPNATASLDRIVSYYGTHGTEQTISGVVLSIGALLFLIFSATFVARLHTESEAPGAAMLCLLGAGLLVVGLTIYAGLAISMADVADHVRNSALEALNVLADGAVFVFLITIGTSAFLLGAAALVLTSRVLPRWLGWLAVAFAIVAAIPSHVLGGALDHIGLVAFAGLGVWTLIVGVLLAWRPEAA